MKRLIYPLAFMALLFIGCNKQLDQQPISDLSSKLFWKTPDDAALGNAAIYDGIQKAFSSNGSFIEWGDARSDNFTYGGTGTNQITVSLNGLNSTTGSASWDNLYVAISRANFAIKYLPGISGLSETNRNNYLAQAYGVRAYMYFYLVRLWGDVPVSLTPYEDINANPDLPRSPADSILNSIIIPDLLKADTLANPTIKSTFFLNTGGILSILTDVYMWQKNYTKVIETTNKLMALNRYSLVPAANYRDVFVLGNTKENIWSLDWDYLVDGGNGGVSNIAASDHTSNYYIDSIPFLRLESNPGDIRRWALYDTTVSAALQRIISIWKYFPVDPATTKPAIAATKENQAKLPLYRWADILLLRAEALNATGDKTGAFTLLNQIRTRANVPTLDESNYASQDDVETAILDERQLELFAEGKRWFDLVRTGRVINVMDPLIRQRESDLGIDQTGFADPRKILWPISRNALVGNPLLIQNPPYSN